MRKYDGAVVTEVPDLLKEPRFLSNLSVLVLKRKTRWLSFFFQVEDKDSFFPQALLKQVSPWSSGGPGARLMLVSRPTQPSLLQGFQPLLLPL
jgi:hypothetical protein